MSVSTGAFVRRRVIVIDTLPKTQCPRFKGVTKHPDAEAEMFPPGTNVWTDQQARIALSNATPQTQKGIKTAIEQGNRKQLIWLITDVLELRVVFHKKGKRITIVGAAENIQQVNRIPMTTVSFGTGASQGQCPADQTTSAPSWYKP